MDFTKNAGFAALGYVISRLSTLPTMFHICPSPPTSVVVLSVLAVLLRPDVARLPLPPRPASASPPSSEVRPARPVAVALARAPVQCAVAPVPPGDAEAVPALALAVGGAAPVAGAVGAARARPPWVAGAGAVLAPAVLPALQPAESPGAVLPDPAGLAGAAPSIEVEPPVARAVWKALPRIVVDLNKRGEKNQEFPFLFLVLPRGRGGLTCAHVSPCHPFLQTHWPSTQKP